MLRSSSAPTGKSLNKTLTLNSSGIHLPLPTPQHLDPRRAPSPAWLHPCSSGSPAPGRCSQSPPGWCRSISGSGGCKIPGSVPHPLSRSPQSCSWRPVCSPAPSSVCIWLKHSKIRSWNSFFPSQPRPGVFMTLSKRINQISRKLCWFLLEFQPLHSAKSSCKITLNSEGP